MSAGAAGGDAKDFLAALGLQAEERWPWAHVGTSERREGWKIHLTCTPLQLSRLVEHVVRVRLQAPFDFKTIASVDLAMLLNEGAFGDTQIGKCVTIYPDDDESFVMLVNAFRAIDDITGPVVRDDIRLGRVVFARFGAINPITRRDILGQFQTLICDERNELVVDRYDRTLTEARFSARFSRDPIFEYVQPPDALPTGIVNGRYLIVDVLRETAKGALLQALDVRSKDSIRALIVKQGRAHVLSDWNGHDIRDRLRHQERMHARASGKGIAPACDPYFQIGEDGYLPILFQHNDNFESWVQTLLTGQTIDQCPSDSRRTILTTLDTIGGLLEGLHELGIVHRDVSPSNILIRSDGQPLISDLEIAWDAASAVIYGKGTPGFMAPEQMASAPPSPAADVHAYSALILYAITGLDPRRLPMPERSDDWRSLRRLGRSLSSRLWSALKAGLAPESRDRPSLSILRGALREDLRVPKPAHQTRRKSSELRTLLVSATASLSSPALVDGGSGMWLSAPITTHPQGAQRPEIRRSFNRGVAGPLYYCARFHRHFDLPDDVRRLCENTAAWLTGDREAADYGMPGLHFGEAGVLLALYEARSVGLTSFTHRDVDHLWRAVLEPQPYWPDFTHGAAGVSVGLGLLAELLDGDAELPPFDLAAERRRQVTHLVHTQNADGSWTLPSGVDGLSGEIVTGFAHGVAGMAYALAVAPESAGNAASLKAAIRAADWLLETAYPSREGRLSWPYSDRQPEPWTWWCHGAPGISSLFLALSIRTGRKDYRDAAIRCFAEIPDGFNPANLSLCHGASGLCELLLDVGLAYKRSELVGKAKDIADSICARHARGTHDVYWIVENTDFVGADLMVGLSGVLHLLLRLASNDPKMCFPSHTPHEFLTLPHIG